MKTTIKNLEGIKWQDQIIQEGNVDEEDITLLECVQKGEIEIGDTVLVQDALDCGLYGLLEDKDFLVTFDNMLTNDTHFLQVGIFSLEECKILFGSDFKYISYEEDSNLTEEDKND